MLILVTPIANPEIPSPMLSPMSNPEFATPMRTDSRSITPINSIPTAPHGLTPTMQLENQNIWWESPEARKLFNAHEDESNIAGFLRQIDILKNANRKEDSYLSLISGNDTIDKSTLWSFDLHVIRQKSVLLCIALNLAVENMNKWTWLYCCKRALKAGERIGINIAKNPKSVQKWYIAFRGKRGFTVPLQRKHNLPPFLQLSPDACHAMKTFGLSNLSILTVESMSEFLHVNVLPAMASYV